METKLNGLVNKSASVQWGMGGLYIILNLSFKKYVITPNVVCLCDNSVMWIINPRAGL